VLGAQGASAFAAITRNSIVYKVLANADHHATEVYKAGVLQINSRTAAKRIGWRRSSRAATTRKIEPEK
jgi:hypothetical protein